MKFNYILLGIASVIIILVMSKKGLKEGQASVGTAPRTAPGGMCAARDIVRIGNRWEDCCVQCGQGYSTTSTRGDGGRCLTCDVRRPLPKPVTCASITCPKGKTRNTTQICKDTGCTETDCCSKIPREEIPNCIKHLGWGKNCLECNGTKGYRLNSAKDNCEMIPIVQIPNCSRQRSWGKHCIDCNIGYKANKIRDKCNLIPIENCKTQEREICLVCNEGWEPSSNGRKCNRIPKADIKHCTKQREWGAHCYECGNKCSGRRPSENKEKCEPIPINNCAKQTEILCESCKYGYKLSKNARKCLLGRIENCARQEGVVCGECKSGYRLSENRRACTILPIKNCSVRNESDKKELDVFEEPDECSKGTESEDTSENTSEDKSTGQSKGKTKELLGADFASFAAADAKQRDGFRSLFGGEGCSGFGKNNLYSICF